MDNTPSPEEIKESINIEQGNKKYVLNIKTQGEKITLIISYPEGNGNSIFASKITLKEIKEIHSLFLGLNSCNEFIFYLKNLAERKKLSIIKKDDKLAINLSIEYLFKNTSLDIILSPEKIS